MAENNRIPSADGGAPGASRGSDALGDMLSKLMAHPEVISYVASAIGVDKPASASPPAPDESPTDAPAAISDGAPLPSEPAALPSAAEPKAPDGNDMLATIAPLLSGLSGLSKGLGKSDGGHGGKKDCRAALLLALKPYVSPGRCEAIDYMLRFSKLADLLKTLR